jgi:predicted 2-oxoglutarate/Fe(II)-dependent dioxygenase YbiX
MDLQLSSSTFFYSKQKSKSKLEDFIKVYDGIIDQDNCDNIIAEYMHSNEWKAGRLINNKNDYTNNTVRNCDIIEISTKASVDINHAARKKIDSFIFEKAGYAVSKYRNDTNDTCCDSLKHHISNDTGYTLLRYKEGGFYKQHTDSGKLASRSVSLSFNLNDSYEGGEFAFFDRELIFKLKKGSVILFPSNFMYPHEIMPVTKGTRYSVITWFN